MNATLATFGEYRVERNPDFGTDDDAYDAEYLVLDADGDVMDFGGTVAEAEESARELTADREADRAEERKEGLRGEIESLLCECDDLATLEKIRALLGG